jgi:hypothetical protein
MALTDFTIRPGIVTIKTDRGDGKEARWKSGDKVRFFNGLPQKVGGWVKATVTQFLGVCRGTWDWQTLAFIKYIGVGTNLKLYVYQGGSFYDITPLRVSGTLANNPFTTIIGLFTVSVHHVAHAEMVGDYVHYSGAAAVGGITINGEYTVTSVTGVDDYVITHSIAATSSVTGGGAAVAYQYEIHVGPVDSVFGLGWGAGTWSTGTWGTARTISTFLTLARTWKMESWGEDLIANYRGGGIYLWVSSVGTGTRAALIAGAPATAKGIFVSAENRILVAYGAHSGTADDPMLVRWSDSENYANFVPDVINNVAGSKRLDQGTELLGHAKTRSGVVIQSDSFAWMMTFDGPPNTFGWTPLGSNGNLVGPNAMVEADGIVYWMGGRNFYIFDGSIKILPCEVHNHVFESINFIQKHKVWAGSNQAFTEIWWLYPSANSTECDSYVLYNRQERTWSIGTIGRTAFVGNSKIFQNAYAFGSDRFLYDHEFGVDADGAAMDATVESGDGEIGEGDQVMRVRKLVPDFKVLSGSISITLKGRKYPQRTQQFSKGPFTVTSSTAYINPKIRARQVALALRSNEVGGNFRCGTFRLELKQSGKR